MLGDADQRVIPSVLAALVKLKAPTAAAMLLERLKADDPVVRAAAARRARRAEAGQRRARRSPRRIASASAMRCTRARAAALAALAKYGAAAATPVLRDARSPTRTGRCASARRMLLKQLDPAAAADADAQIRPAPTTVAPDVYHGARGS